MTTDRPTCLGIVTARSGSKGIPRKNVRDLAGRPMIHYAITAGIACRYIDRVMITTDSPEIAEVARAAGAEAPFLRPAEISTDEARQEDAIIHAMRWYEDRNETFDLVCLLQPTEPLRRAETLSSGFELLAAHPEASGVMSVAPARTAPSSVNTLRPDGTLRDFIDPAYRYANRQERPDWYELSAVVAIARWGVLRETGSFCEDTTLAMVVDPVEAIDVDEPLDFILAERLLTANVTSAADAARHLSDGGATRRP